MQGSCDAFGADPYGLYRMHTSTEYMFDLVRDHVNPAVRAVGKSEFEIVFVYCYFSFREKGLNYVYDEITTTENYEMIMHWERCSEVQ